MVLLLLVTVCGAHAWQAAATEPWHGDVVLDEHVRSVLWPLVDEQGNRGWGDGVERVTVTGRIEQVQTLTSTAGPLVEWYLRTPGGAPHRVLMVADDTGSWSSGSHVSVDGVHWQVEAIRGRDGVTRQIPTILAVDVVLGGGVAGAGGSVVWGGVILGLGGIVISLVLLGRRRVREPSLITRHLSSRTLCDDDSGRGSLADDPAAALSQMHDCKAPDS